VTGRHTLLLLLSTTALAAGPAAQLSGTIRDQRDAVVPDAQVTVTNESTGIRRNGVSGPDGVYTLTSLAPGPYKIVVRRAGFQTIAYTGLTLEAAQPVRVDFALKLGRMEQIVTVEGYPPFIHAEDAFAATPIGSELIERLPLNGRGIISLVELAPAVVATPASAGEAGQFSAAGQRPNRNFFTVDGISANTGAAGSGGAAQFTGGTLPGMTAFGSMQNILPGDAIDELSVATSTTGTARMPGAKVTLVSRSGTNFWHGGAFEQFRNQHLAANDWFANAAALPRAALRLNDFGASLGGPLRRDRTFLFASYEGIRLLQPYTWFEPVPSLATRATAPDPVKGIVLAFPLPNGPELTSGTALLAANTSRPSSLDAMTVRIDHALTSRVSLFGRFSHSPSRTQSGYSWTSDLQFSGDSGTLGMTASSGALVSDLRLNVTRTALRAQWRPTGEGGAIPIDLSSLLLPFPLSSADALYRVSVGGLGQILAGRDGTNRETQFELAESLSITHGAHEIRIGTEYTQLAPQRLVPGANVSVIFGSAADLFANRNAIVTYFEAQRASSLLRYLSLYAQDRWHATARLTLTWGFEWSIDPSPKDRLETTGAPPQILASSPALVTPSSWQAQFHKPAASLGMAWKLTKEGNTVLRAGAGIYYDPAFAVAADPVNGAPFNAWRFTSGTSGAGSNVPPYPYPVLYGVAPDLHVPFSGQWNVEIEHAPSSHDVVSISYIGSMGRGLLRRETSLAPSPSSAIVATATNHGRSTYHALDAEYRRKMKAGLTAMAAYTWSHSIDNGSSDSALFLTGNGFNAAQDRASSNFDVRHSFRAAFAWDLPAKYFASNSLARNWSVDGIFHARTGFPIDILTSQDALGLGLVNVLRPVLVPGVPVWNGRQLNPAAFRIPTAFAQGTMGRNAITGFGMQQFDLTLRRQFHLSDRALMALHVDAFNVFNRANLADPVRYLASPLFGQPASMLNLMLGTGTPGSGLAPALQIGGPRTLQLSARLTF
jgi:hypothetical protein